MVAPCFPKWCFTRRILAAVGSICLVVRHRLVTCAALPSGDGERPARLNRDKLPHFTGLCKLKAARVKCLNWVWECGIWWVSSEFPFHIPVWEGEPARNRGHSSQTDMRWQLSVRGRCIIKFPSSGHPSISTRPLMCQCSRLILSGTDLLALTAWK